MLLLVFDLNLKSFQELKIHKKRTRIINIISKVNNSISDYMIAINTDICHIRTKNF